MNWRNIIAIAGCIAVAATGAAAGTTTHRLSKVIIDSGNPQKTLSSGYTALDQTSAYCNSSSCTFAMKIMASVNKATCKDEWAIEGLVDGHSVDGAPYQDGLPGGSNTQTRVWQGTYKTGSGYHTLAADLYLPCSANANQWSVRYFVTTP